ncbi:MAG: M48 family metallopeptidase [Balneolia bacterium]|nr:M48 family metallopeptidase [Balneolia bacterium]
MSAQNLFDCPIRFVKRRRQRYIRIRVKADEVLVSAPFGTPGSEMERFVQEKREWIDANLKKLNEKKSRIVQLNRFDEGFLLYEGEWVPVELSDSNGRSSFTETGFGFQAKLAAGTEGNEAYEVARLYYNWSKSRLEQRFRELAIVKGFTHGNVVIRNQKSKWGSCSGKGNINLNWRLIKCPRFVQDYIFVHEMCHLKHLNHSASYWALVDQHYPGRERAEKWLKEHGPVAFQNP